MKRAAWFELFFLSALAAIGVASRVLPHPWNVTFVIPVSVAIGLSLSRGQSMFLSRHSGLVASSLSVAMMLISDLILGLHDAVAFVYAAMVVSAVLGTRALRLPLGGLSTGFFASASFFVISNFGVWLVSGLYPRNWLGLVDCFVMAIPFFQHQVVFDSLVGAVVVWALKRVLQPEVRTAYGK